MSEKRILDPIHGLIAFDLKDETDNLAWALIQTSAFQRLRRIRQLGLADLVFPGATHTRFTHSLGVFHVARLLLARLRRGSPSYDDEMGRAAAIAALLHDLGHGPFSHVFEKAAKMKHEAWTLRIIAEEEEIAKHLKRAGLSEPVRDLFLPGRASPYAQIVSSQFDADRLDYMRRDRYMTGMGGGGFDFDWLLDCLDADWQEGKIFLNRKGIRNAEEYLLARHHLYIHAYMHKGVRGAERVLADLLKRVGESDPLGESLALAAGDLAAYLRLDDSVLLGALHRLREGGGSLSRLSDSLLSRRLPRCWDLATEAYAGGGFLEGDGDRLSARLALFKRRLKESGIGSFYLDETRISAYRRTRAGEKERDTIWTKESEEGELRDIQEVSSLVAAMPEHHIMRLYSFDESQIEAAKKLWRGG